MPFPRLPAACGLALAAVIALTGCSTTVSMAPAPHANDPLCAEVMVVLPKAIGDLDRVWTDAQATAAWSGSGGVAVALTCGLDAPAPTADVPCSELGGVDWLVDDEDSPNLRMTTYGRQPAVEVYVNTSPETGGISSNQALIALAPMVRNIPAASNCIAPNELPE